MMHFDIIAETLETTNLLLKNKLNRILEFAIMLFIIKDICKIRGENYSILHKYAVKILVPFNLHLYPGHFTCTYYRDAQNILILQKLKMSMKLKLLLIAF
jgi:hypothetical protein